MSTYFEMADKAYAKLLVAADAIDHDGDMKEYSLWQNRWLAAVTELFAYSAIDSNVGVEYIKTSMHLGCSAELAMADFKAEIEDSELRAGHLLHLPGMADYTDTENEEEDAYWKFLGV